MGHLDPARPEPEVRGRCFGTLSAVVPAQAGTPTPRRSNGGRPTPTFQQWWLWVPACAGTTAECSQRFRAPHLLRRHPGYRARVAGDFQDVQPGVGAVDEIDIDAIVGLDVIALDRDLALLLAVDL